MPITLSHDLIAKLARLGVSTHHRPGLRLPDNMQLEPPCSLKWMSAEYFLALGAFSYAVSGYYFATRIGRYCSFGEQVQVGRQAHPMRSMSSSPVFYNEFFQVLDTRLPEGVDLIPHRDFPRQSAATVARFTTIGNDVWIGHGAFVLPGVTIGDGAIVAAMSVVTKDVPPYAVVAGNPAQIKRYRFSEQQIEKLQQTRWWEFAPWQLKNAPVDDIDALPDFITGLRAQNLPVYAPEIIELARLAASP